MSTHANDMILLTPTALASAVMDAIFTYEETPASTQSRARIHRLLLHFHDGAQSPIAWNDVEAVLYRNKFLGTDMAVPLTATEGYHQHGHVGEYDGGYLPGRSNHDHRDNLNGGFAFAVYHPGTDLPQQHFAI